MVTNLLSRIQQISRDCVKKHEYRSALYWADKATSLSLFHPSDVYHLAQCMFFCQQYERAAVMIIKRQLHIKKVAFRYLAAKCYVESKQWQAALDLLEQLPQDELLSKKHSNSLPIEGVPEDKELLASIHLLKGDIYEAMEVREAAAECYKEALRLDVFSFEAFDRLTAHHLMRAEEEEELLDAIPLADQCVSEEEQELYNKPSQFEIPETFNNLHENLDIATSLAERHYYNCEFRTGFKMTEGILKADPSHTNCLPLHVALLVELKEANKLFYLAHQLVAKHPDLPISWFAVGCYYLLQPKKQELCRRYLLKATILDKTHGPAWLAYGHSFASQNEHDQAMAAYFTASQLMKGCHLPFLYIGLEYSITNNTKLAEKFFTAALNISADDPHVLHEMGAAFYNNKNYQGALKYFSKALDQVRILGDEVSIEEWEPLLNNLGHTYRKMKDFPQALECHRQALTLSPHSADTYSAIGLVYSYMENYMEAIEYLHKSLGLRRDDVFTSNLLETVIQKFAETDLPLSGEDLEQIPPLPDARLAYKHPASKAESKLEIGDSFASDIAMHLQTPPTKDLPTTSQAWSSNSGSTSTHPDAPSIAYSGPVTRSGGKLFAEGEPQGDDMEMDHSIE